MSEEKLVLSHNDILNLEKYYRINLINKISGLKSANLIGTASKNGQTNLAIFNSVIHVGANPPYLGFLLRPLTVERQTYNNIKETGYFTINQIIESIHQQAHQTSAKYPSETSEFDACELTAYWMKDFGVPFVDESPIKIGLSFVEEQEIKANGTVLIVGKIDHLILPKSSVNEEGHINLETLGGIGIGGLDTYYSCKEIAQYEFARPNKKTTIKTG